MPRDNITLPFRPASLPPVSFLSPAMPLADEEDLRPGFQLRHGEHRVVEVREGTFQLDGPQELVAAGRFGPAGLKNCSPPTCQLGWQMMQTLGKTVRVFLRSLLKWMQTKHDENRHQQQHIVLLMRQDLRVLVRH